MDRFQTDIFEENLDMMCENKMIVLSTLFDENRSLSLSLTVIDTKFDDIESNQ
jgi:hypothetical protein